MSEKAVCIIATVCCCFVTIMIFVQFMTIKTVDFNYVAIKQSILNKQIEKKEIYF